MVAPRIDRIPASPLTEASVRLFLSFLLPAMVGALTGAMSWSLWEWVPSLRSTALLAAIAATASWLYLAAALDLPRSAAVAAGLGTIVLFALAVAARSAPQLLPLAAGGHATLSAGVALVCHRSRCGLPRLWVALSAFAAVVTVLS